MSNPYTPPDAPVTDPKGRKKHRPAVALLDGLAIDIGGTIILSIILSIAYGASLAATGLDAEQIAEAIRHIPMTSWVMIVGIIGGCMLSAVGGYTCARMAQENEFALGAVMAILSIVLGVLMSGGPESIGFQILGAVLTFLSVMIGVRFGAARNVTD